jgi:phosphatidylglycerophosphate synthase
MLDAVRVIYRESKKQRDNFWTEWLSRPPAAVLVWLLAPTRVTPNQVSFLSLFVFALAAVLLVAWPGRAAPIVAALVIQLSYVLDCVDGQLARHKRLASSVGALLDFLADEVKAFLLVGALAVRLWAASDDPRWLLAGIGGLVAVATGIALTTFMRRPEYAAAAGRPPSEPPASPGSGPLAWIERAGRLVLHYPTHFWLFAVADRLDLFLVVYLAAHALYLGRAGLAVVVKLGRPARGDGSGAA